MKFRMNFGIVKTVIVAVIIVGALAIAALDIAMLAGANGVATQQPAVAWVSIVAAVIIAVAALLVLFNSYYGFKEDKMVSVLGFFVDKIKYDDVICIKQNLLSGRMLCRARSPAISSVMRSYNFCRLSASIMSMKSMTMMPPMSRSRNCRAISSADAILTSSAFSSCD